MVPRIKIRHVHETIEKARKRYIIVILLAINFGFLGYNTKFCSQFNSINCRETVLESGEDIRSSHFCTGNIQSPSAWHGRTCMFRSICYNATSNMLLYIGDVDLDAIKVTASPQSAVWSVKAKTLDLALTPRLNDSKIVWHDRAYAFYFSYNAENFGHFLTDELLPIFHASQLFGIDVDSLQMVRINPKESDIDLFPYTCDWNRKHNITARVENCRNNYHRMGSLLSKKGITSLKSFDDGRTHCYDQVISGFGLLSDHCYDSSHHGNFPEKLNPLDRNCNQGKGAILWNFRQHLMQQQNIVEASSTTWNVLVSTTHSERRKYPLFEMIHMNLRKRLHGLLLCGKAINIQEVRLDSVDIKEQMKLMAQTTIMIACTGGSSYASIFLPRWSYLILYTGSDKKARDDLFLGHLSHVEISFLYPSDRLVESTTEAVVNALSKRCRLSIYE